MKEPQPHLANRESRWAFCLGVFGIFTLLAGGFARGQEVSARAALEANSAFVGEAVRFQIQVEGADRPEAPDLSGLADFTVEAQGSGSNSRVSISQINGRVQRNEQLGYIFNYALTPKREGRLSIPPISIKAGGQTAQTRPLTLVARKPAEQDNFKLRVTLAKDVAYVGEPIVMDVEFYYSADVRDAHISMPSIEGDNFHVYTLENSPAAEQTQELGGKRFQTMRLRRVLVPKAAETITLEPATLSFEGVSGYQAGRDFFGQAVRQPAFKHYVIPSNQVKLEVRDLPAAGRPKGFAGHIGEYQLAASATPQTVNVGDPITLTLTLSGPPYLEHVQFPALKNQEALTRDFQVPDEMAEGAVSGNFKTFTVVIRAARQDVKEIPPVELPYFDSDAGEYKVARSKPIPITVNATNVVTIDDAEGLAPVTGGSSQVEAQLRGIAHNYEDPRALHDQHFDFFAWLRSPGIMALLGAPPAAYFALLAFTGARRKRAADPARVRSRKALGELQRNLGGAGDSSAVLEAFRGFLGDKLNAASGALTFKDVTSPLSEMGAAAETIDAVRRLFDQCEATRYAGGGDGADAGIHAAAALELARALEKQLK